MNTELLRALCLEQPERLSDLRTGHAVLGIAGIVHDLKAFTCLTERERAAGVEAAADLLRDIADRAFQKVHVCEIVQIDDCTQLCRQPVILGRGLIGREHNMRTDTADAFGHHQLRER